MPIGLPSVDGNGPTLATLMEVARLLEAAQDEGPISLAELGRRMAAKQVRHATLRTSVDFWSALGYATTGRGGVLWTYQPDPRAWDAAAGAVPL